MFMLTANKLCLFKLILYTFMYIFFESEFFNETCIKFIGVYAYNKCIPPYITCTEALVVHALNSMLQSSTLLQRRKHLFFNSQWTSVLRSFRFNLKRKVWLCLCRTRLAHIFQKPVYPHIHIDNNKSISWHIFCWYFTILWHD